MRKVTTVNDIQKKLILSKVVEMLSVEHRTRTYLKRYVASKLYSEADVEAAIEFGILQGTLKLEKQGYVELDVNNRTLLESDYYECVAEMLSNHYQAILTKEGNFLISQTARKDTKVAGRWTRPDFTIVAHRKFPYIRETEFDVITFEVKRPADCEALAVFEALAHNSAATRSYVFFPVTETELAKNPQGSRIREECVRHGIGLFLVADSFSLNEARLIIESQRQPLNPEKCSNFLQNVLDATALSKLTTWH